MSLFSVSNKVSNSLLSLSSPREGARGGACGIVDVIMPAGSTAAWCTYPLAVAGVAGGWCLPGFRQVAEVLLGWRRARAFVLGLPASWDLVLQCLWIRTVADSTV